MVISVWSRKTVDIHGSPQQNLNNLFYSGLDERLSRIFLCSLFHNRVVLFF